MKRKRLLTAAAGTLIAAAIAGVAYATIPGSDNVYNACMLKGVGTIRLIDKSLPSTNLMSHCTDKETEVSWNQAGQPGPAGPAGAKGEPGAPGTNGTNGTNGKDGVSVTSAAEPAGANCAGGGVQLTVLTGVSYVCNGKAGVDGRDGTNGTDGVDGDAGVSVTSADEPAGTNCANGGSKFTAANGVSYACNGRNGTSSGPSECGREASLAVNVAGCATLTLGGPPTPIVGVCYLDGGVPGQLLTIYWASFNYFQSACGNIKLDQASRAGPTGNETLQLVFTGLRWLEVSYSANS
jgi:hypothetical protein